jgi:hypothetical protein
MHKCSATPARVVKGDKSGTFQCPQNKHESNQMMLLLSEVLCMLKYALVLT